MTWSISIADSALQTNHLSMSECQPVSGRLLSMSTSTVYTYVLLYLYPSYQRVRMTCQSKFKLPPPLPTAEHIGPVWITEAAEASSAIWPISAFARLSLLNQKWLTQETHCDWWILAKWLRPTFSEVFAIISASIQNGQTSSRWVNRWWNDL